MAEASSARPAEQSSVEARAEMTRCGCRLTSLVETVAHHDRSVFTMAMGVSDTARIHSQVSGADDVHIPIERRQ